MYIQDNLISPVKSSILETAVLNAPKINYFWISNCVHGLDLKQMEYSMFGDMFDKCQKSNKILFNFHWDDKHFKTPEADTTQENIQTGSVLWCLYFFYWFLKNINKVDFKYAGSRDRRTVKSVKTWDAWRDGIAYKKLRLRTGEASVHNHPILSIEVATISKNSEPISESTHIRLATASIPILPASTALRPK